MWAVRTKSGRCGATTSRTLKVRGTLSELAVVSVSITAYRWPHWCIKDDLKTSRPMTHTPLFNSQRAYCVTPLLFPEIEFICCGVFPTDDATCRWNLNWTEVHCDFSWFSSFTFAPAVAPPCFLCIMQKKTSRWGEHHHSHMLSIQVWNWTCESFWWWHLDTASLIKKRPKSVPETAWSYLRIYCCFLQHVKTLTAWHSKCTQNRWLAVWKWS